MCQISTWFSCPLIIRLPFTSTVTRLIFAELLYNIWNNTPVTSCILSVCVGYRRAAPFLYGSNHPWVLLGGDSSHRGLRRQHDHYSGSLGKASSSRLVYIHRPSPHPHIHQTLSPMTPPSSSPWWTTFGWAWACRRPSQPQWCLWTQRTGWILGQASMRWVHFFFFYNDCYYNFGYNYHQYYSNP